MILQQHCLQCGDKLIEGANFCGKCGTKIETDTTRITTISSDKSPTIVLILAILLGGMGIHRFYVNKIGTGILMLVTGGGLGIWYLIDLALIICNKFRDKEGHIIELSKKPPSFKKVMIVFGILISVFLGGIITLVTMLMLFMGNLSDVAKDQLAALRNGDIGKAYAYTSNEFQKHNTAENFTAFVEHYHLLTNKDASFRSTKFEGNTGELKGVLTLKDGTRYDVEYHLKKESGKWKIREIEISPTESESPFFKGGI